ncbi:MAG: ABC transporter ATP-binding protein [Actinomycetaceae bacterium]|nr:ABC transporter ATP-binding protein [Actinomycetaceae bacterium]
MSWGYLRTQKRAVAAIVVLQLFQVLLNLWLPALNAAIINNGIIPHDQGYIWRTGMIMLAIALLQVASIVGAIYFGARTAMGFGRELRATTFRKVQGFSNTDQHRFGAATLITRTTNDVTQVQMVVLMFFTMMIMAPLMGIGGIVMAIVQDAKLSLLLAIIVPILALLVGFVMRQLTPRSVIQQQRIDRVNTVMREQLTGVRVIRAFVREKTERKKYDHAIRDLRAIGLEIGMLMTFLMPAAHLVIGLSSAATVWFGGFRIAAGNMEVGVLTAYISYLMMILGSIMMSGFFVMMFPRGEVSAQRIKEIHDTVPSIQAPANPRTLPTGPLTFELKRACLQYPGAETPVLEEISLVCPPGSTVAVVGSTGSGKSSILKLLPRLIDATSGQVRVGGIPVTELDPRELRSRIAFVPQKAFLFSGTIASNVAGNVRPESSYDAERVRLALDAAQATEFVDKLADGLETAVEAGGTNFSGGQRQRLTIARAIYRCLPDKTGKRSADLLIFDDSFSALDAVTDARLRANLRNYIGDIAVLIIGQRISTIRHADIIHVLEDGRISGSGTHEQLYKFNQTYQEIVTSQMSEEEAL